MKGDEELARWGRSGEFHYLHPDLLSLIPASSHSTVCFDATSWARLQNGPWKMQVAMGLLDSKGLPHQPQEE